MHTVGKTFPESETKSKKNPPKSSEENTKKKAGKEAE